MIAFSLTALHWLGVVVYGGSLIALAALMLASRALPAVDPQAVMRVWRSWGAGLGLAMGGLILGGLGRYYQIHEGFLWPTSTPAEQLTAAKHALFLVLWFSSFHLEIWTLEPLRKIERGALPPEAWDAAARRVTLQATLNAALFIAVGMLALAAA